MSDNESSPSSSYCLLSNGNLHFLPYSNSKNDQATYQHYPLYSTFLNNKTVSSFDSCASATNNNAGASGTQHHNHNSSNLTKQAANTSRLLNLLENYKSHAIYLPDHYIPLEEDGDQKEKIKSLLLKIFNHWNTDEGQIQIKKLTGGITNMLLECTYTSDRTNDTEKVLVRTYGNGTDLIIDRDREFVSHLVLNSLNLAPSIHARFGNGLVYGYIEGRSLNFEELSNTGVYPLIASKLACLHKLTDVHTIDESLYKLKQKFQLGSSHSSSNPSPVSSPSPSPAPSYFTTYSQTNIWSVLSDWVQKLPHIPAMENLCLQNKDIIADSNRTGNSTLVKILSDEISWLKQEIDNLSVTVTSHNDLLSGNIIIPSSLDLDSSQENFIRSAEKFDSNPLSFIDYEYMMPAPRAFDIANHFMEWQGFDCDKSKVPQFKYNPQTNNYENETVFKWCQYYIPAFHASNPDLNPYYSSNFHPSNNKAIGDNTIQQLVNEIAYHYGMPGLYWGIWAGIQSEISLIDFDYSSYSCERLVEYWNWKRTYLSNRS